MRSLLSVSLIALAVLPVRADDAPDPEREARLAYVRDRFHEWTLTPAPTESTPSPAAFKNGLEPLVRYTNPIGGLVRDGTFFVWRDESGRPVAACSYSVRGPQSPHTVFFEMTSLVGSPLICQRVADGRARWTPKSTGLYGHPVQNVPATANRPVARLTAMRNIARRFEATNALRDGAVSALRLLPQPIDRFHDEKSGLIDAGLFAFVEANDPEILVLIEARAEAKGAALPEETSLRWTATVARMTSRKVEVRLDGTEVFSAPNFWQSPKSPEDPYLEASSGTMVLEPASSPVPSASPAPRKEQE